MTISGHSFFPLLCSHFVFGLTSRTEFCIGWCIEFGIQQYDYYSSLYHVDILPTSLALPFIFEVVINFIAGKFGC